MLCKHPPETTEQPPRMRAAFFVRRKHAGNAHRTHNSRRPDPIPPPAHTPRQNAPERSPAGTPTGSPTSRPTAGRQERRQEAPQDARKPRPQPDTAPAAEAPAEAQRTRTDERRRNAIQPSRGETRPTEAKQARPPARPAERPAQPPRSEAERGEADRKAAQHTSTTGSRPNSRRAATRRNEANASTTDRTPSRKRGETRRTTRPESRRNADRRKYQPEKRPKRPAAGRQNAPTICADRKPPQTAAARQRQRSGTQLWTAAGSPEIAMQKTPEQVKRLLVNLTSIVNQFARPKQSNRNFSSSNRRQMPQLFSGDPAKNAPTFRFAELPLGVPKRGCEGGFGGGRCGFHFNCD